MEYKTVENCKTREEAIAKSGLKVGQLLRIAGLRADGNVNGTWTIRPIVEEVKTDDQASSINQG